MSNFDIDLQLRKRLKRRIQQLTGFFDVKCEVLEVMANDMGIDSSDPHEEVRKYYREVSVMTDEEFRRRLFEAIKKIQKKKEIVGVC